MKPSFLMRILLFLQSLLVNITEIICKNNSTNVLIILCMGDLLQKLQLQIGPYLKPPKAAKIPSIPPITILYRKNMDKILPYQNNGIRNLNLPFFGAPFRPLRDFRSCCLSFADLIKSWLSVLTPFNSLLLSCEVFTFFCFCL